MGPPLGVHGGNVEGDSLEPEHHEQPLGEGAVPNLGPITASLKSNPIPALGLVCPSLTRRFPEPPASSDLQCYTLPATPIAELFSLWARVKPRTDQWVIFSKGRLLPS